VRPRGVAAAGGRHQRFIRGNSRPTARTTAILRQIARGRGDAAEVAAVTALPQQIVALTSDALHRAAETYLKTDSYVQVTLMSGKK
jgi:hypothetical protein